MEKNFRMNFVDDKGNPVVLVFEIEEIKFCSMRYRIGSPIGYTDRAYIAPESVGLLEPKEDDLIFGWAGRIGFVEDVDDKKIHIDVNGGSWYCPRKNDNVDLTYKIITRDDEPFFWPKWEDVK